MKSKAIFPKVALDMFVVQGVWALGFLGVMVIINIIKIGRAMIYGTEVDHFFNSVYVAANIFMLVIGIICIYFLPHYVGHGVTRKNYFKGALLASIGLSISIPIVAWIVSAIEYFILKNMITFKAVDLNSVVSEVDSNLIGDIVQSVILTPYIDPNNNIILALAILSLNIFIYYILGWFISVCFYRFNAIIGIGSVVVALLMSLLLDTFIRVSLGLPVFHTFAFLDVLPKSIAPVGILFFILLPIAIIHLLTRRVVIKM